MIINVLAAVIVAALALWYLGRPVLATLNALGPGHSEFEALVSVVVLCFLLLMGLLAAIQSRRRR